MVFLSNFVDLSIISTNNITIELVRDYKIRFRPTTNTLSSAFRKLHIMPPVSQKLFVKKRSASSSFAPHICLMDRGGLPATAATAGSR
jgi:hypothetical protein